MEGDLELLYGRLTAGDVSQFTETEKQHLELVIPDGHVDSKHSHAILNGVIMHADSDSDKAEKIRDFLSKGNMANGEKPDVRLEKDAFQWIRPLFENLEHVLKYSSCIFVIFSRSFMEDNILTFKACTSLLESLENDCKKYSFIPVYLQDRKKLDFEMPLIYHSLNPLVFEEGNGRSIEKSPEAITAIFNANLKYKREFEKAQEHSRLLEKQKLLADNRQEFFPKLERRLQQPCAMLPSKVPDEHEHETVVKELRQNDERVDDLDQHFQEIEDEPASPAADGDVTADTPSFPSTPRSTQHSSSGPPVCSLAQSPPEAFEEARGQPEDKVQSSTSDQETDQPWGVCSLTQSPPEAFEEAGGQPEDKVQSSTSDQETDQPRGMFSMVTTPLTSLKTWVMDQMEWLE